MSTAQHSMLLCADMCSVCHRGCAHNAESVCRLACWPPTSRLSTGNGSFPLPFVRSDVPLLFPPACCAAGARQHVQGTPAGALQLCRSLCAGAGPARAAGAVGVPRNSGAPAVCRGCVSATLAGLGGSREPAAGAGQTLSGVCCRQVSSCGRGSA